MNMLFKLIQYFKTRNYVHIKTRTYCTMHHKIREKPIMSKISRIYSFKSNLYFNNQSFNILKSQNIKTAKHSEG